MKINSQFANLRALTMLETFYQTRRVSKNCIISFLVVFMDFVGGLTLTLARARGAVTMAIKASTLRQCQGETFSFFVKFHFMPDDGGE